MLEICADKPLTSVELCNGPVVYHCLHIVCSQGAKVCPLTLVVVSVAWNVLFTLSSPFMFKGISSL